MVGVVAHDEQLALRHGDGIVERLAVFGVAQVRRLEGIALVERLPVDVDDAGIEIDIDRLPADRDDALDQQLVVIRERRRVQNHDVALSGVSVEEIALQHQIVLVHERRIHRAAADAVHAEKEHEHQRDDREHPHQIK